MGINSELIKDGNSLAQRFRASGQKIDGELAQAITRCALRVERRAKQYVKVDTGRLRASISHRLEIDREKITGVIGTNVFYAPYLEYGTERMRYPFLRPALQMSERDNIEDIRQTIVKAKGGV